MVRARRQDGWQHPSGERGLASISGDCRTKPIAPRRAAQGCDPTGRGHGSERRVQNGIQTAPERSAPSSTDEKLGVIRSGRSVNALIAALGKLMH